MIVKCPDCGAEVSKQAQVCPNCGCPTHLVRSLGTIKLFIKRWVAHSLTLASLGVFLVSLEWFGVVIQGMTTLGVGIILWALVGLLAVAATTPKK